MNEYKTSYSNNISSLIINDETYSFQGKWISGLPWERFGRYNYYIVINKNGRVKKIKAHAGELVPGSTEDLISVLKTWDKSLMRPKSPLTLEIDPTYKCLSDNCGSHCFSYPYRVLSPCASLTENLMKNIITDFSGNGGRIVRFDGGGDPLLHESVRNGNVIEIASLLNLKTTILTSGDVIKKTNLKKIGESGCYLRISLNASTNKTRYNFHRSPTLLTDILNEISDFNSWLVNNNIILPVGVSFLLSPLNYHEVYECAKISKEIGVSHFSIRRILGPEKFRYNFNDQELEIIYSQFKKIKELDDSSFISFIPWRSLNESDLIPQKDFFIKNCWQSTFKTVVEPSNKDENSYRMQLCGRYRGNGVGQQMQLDPLLESNDGVSFNLKWQDSFSFYPIPRQKLPEICGSCIDRGFMLMIDEIMDFLDYDTSDFSFLHLQSDDSI